MRARISNFLLLAVLAGSQTLATIDAASADEASVYRRWGIVATSQLQTAGVSDLLTAELSQLRGIELVDREQLAAAAEELELAAYFGTQNAAHRLKLGQQVKADALLLLSLAGRDNRSLKVVVSDCRYGARLRVEHFAYPPRDMDDLAKDISSLVEETRRRYARGIRHIVGVPHFVSRNLVHDHDHLQAGYAHLLEKALAEYSGVAVIETEEALAIRQELALAGDAVQRVVPILMEAEFEVTRAPADAGPLSGLQVAFSLVARGADDQWTVNRQLPLSQAPGFLTGEAPAGLLRLRNGSPDSKAFSAKEQLRWLVERADSFAKLGFWEDAAGLREAAVLLSPDDVALRQRLIGEYRRSSRRPIDLPQEFRRPGSTRWKAAVRLRVDAYLAGLAHLEWLIRNRQIDADRAVSLVAQQTTYGLISPMPFESQAVDGKLRRLGAEELELAERAEEQFMAGAYPLVLQLPRGPAKPTHRYAELAFLELWENPLLESTILRVDRVHRTRDDLDHIFHVITKVLPDQLPTVHGVTQFLESGYRYWDFGSDERKQLPDDAIDEQDWLALLRRLAAADHQVAAACGHYGLLQWKWKHRGRFQQEDGWMEQLLADANSLLSEFAALPYAAPANQARSNEWIYSQTKSIRYHVASELQPPVRASLTPSKLPPNWKTDPQLWRQYGYPITMGKLKFEPVPLKLRQLDDRTVSFSLGERFRSTSGWVPLHDFLRCDSMDVMWNTSVVVAMSERGVFDVLVDQPGLWIDDVAWDGRHLWAFTRRAGLWVVDPTHRKVLLKITDEHGLPPADRRSRLLPLGPGKLLAVGSFGEQRRAWCAVVEYRGGEPKIEIFHRATHVPVVGFREAPGDDAEMTFEPEWIYQPGVSDRDSPSRRLVLVGRDAPSLDARQRPLRIDPITLAVSVTPRSDDVRGRGNPKAAYLPSGDILEPRMNHLLHWPRPGELFANGKPYREICGNVTNAGLLSGVILEFQGQLYAPGSRWYRIDPQSLEAEMLVPGRLPNEWSMRRFSVSAHYGLIAWGGSNAGSSDANLFRVTIDK